MFYIPIIGHPSAGKSTLIRLLTGKKVAVGKSSGTTRKINHIQISENVTILDFPGYGRLSHRSRSFADFLQQQTIDYLEEIKSSILVGIVISDLSNIELVANKLDSKGYIPIDYELAEFALELSNRTVIVLGNKIDKLTDTTDYNEFINFYPKDIMFFPVSLKFRKGLEPFLTYLQMVCDDLFDELQSFFWKFT